MQQQMSDAYITKNDTPYMARSWWLWGSSAVLVAMWALLLAEKPGIRPGVVEVCIALAFAVPAAKAVGPGWVQYMSELSEICHRHKWVKWMLFIYRPPWPLPGYFRLVKAVSLLFGLSLVASGMLCLVWSVFPTLSMPWAEFAYSTPDGIIGLQWSLVAMMVFYHVAALVQVAYYTLRWYSSLPDQS